MNDERDVTAPTDGPSIDGRALLRHQLAGLAFRFTHAVRDAPPAFASFDAGRDVRTPMTIVRHIADVLEHGRCHLAGEERPRRSATAADDWVEAVDAVYVRLETLDALVADPHVVRDDDRMRAFVHGPLTDAATHVGQLAMLRRLFGNAVAPVSYFRAPVRTGRIRPSGDPDD